MRIASWNVARGGKPAAWQHAQALGADVLLLQEAAESRLPPGAAWAGAARRKKGTLQPWGSAIAVRDGIRWKQVQPNSAPWPRLGPAIAALDGVVVAVEVQSPAGPVVVVSCHSPAWYLHHPTAEEDVALFTEARLRAQPKKVWLADLLWLWARDAVAQGKQLVLGGDFNLCPAFDLTFGKGNREYIARMAEAGLTEAIRHFHPDEGTTPTFRNARSRRIEHQLDYVWVSPGLKPRLRSCTLGDRQLLQHGVSDHLPVVVELDV